MDLETGSKERYKRVGNYFYNPIVAIGLCVAGQVRSDYYKDPGFMRNLQDWLSLNEVLVAHNAKFDLLYLWNESWFQDWLRSGGKIWDTQYAEYLLSGNQEKYTSLRDLAVRKYGCKEREKLMEPYWNNKKGFVDNRGYLISSLLECSMYNRWDEAYVCHDDECEGCDKPSMSYLEYMACSGYYERIGHINTQDIPRELVLQDVENDVLDTEQVYLQQLKIADSQGQVLMIEVLMDGLLATTEIEYKGMQIDLETLDQNQERLQQELDLKREELQGLVKPYWRIDD